MSDQREVEAQVASRFGNALFSPSTLQRFIHSGECFGKNLFLKVKMPKVFFFFEEPGLQFDELTAHAVTEAGVEAPCSTDASGCVMHSDLPSLKLYSSHTPFTTKAQSQSKLRQVQH